MWGEGLKTPDLNQLKAWESQESGSSPALPALLLLWMQRAPSSLLPTEAQWYTTGLQTTLTAKIESLHHFPLFVEQEGLLPLWESSGDDLCEHSCTLAPVGQLLACSPALHRAMLGLCASQHVTVTPEISLSQHIPATQTSSENTESALEKCPSPKLQSGHLDNLIRVFY